jgi:hypothetical protein
MAYHDFLFPPETPLFPPASHVLNYLADYATHYDLQKHIEFNTKVNSARWDSVDSRWILKVSTRPDSEERFDALIVATGHYSLPYLPSIPGSHEWVASGRKLLHSINYRESSIFNDLTVLIVGGGPSGFDLVNDSAAVAKTVINSVPGTARSDEGLVKRRCAVVKLHPKDGAAIYADGTEDLGIDVIVLATGYSIAYPFLMDQIPHTETPPTGALPDQLICSGTSIYPLARHTFPLRSFSPRTLAFMGLPKRLAPFPAMDSQALAIASVFFSDANDYEAPDFLPVWDQGKEEELVKKNYVALHRRYKGDDLTISKRWHDMVPHFESGGELEDWGDYRAGFLDIAARDIRDEGTRARAKGWRLADWERELYEHKIPLRQEWVKLEREGVTGGWLKDVGKAGPEEWATFMRKVLEHWRARSTTIVAGAGIAAALF